LLKIEHSSVSNIIENLQVALFPAAEIAALGEITLTLVKGIVVEIGLAGAAAAALHCVIALRRQEIE
jgi:hypothetical protein